MKTVNWSAPKVGRVEEPRTGKCVFCREQTEPEDICVLEQSFGATGFEGSKTWHRRCLLRMIWAGLYIDIQQAVKVVLMTSAHVPEERLLQDVERLVDVDVVIIKAGIQAMVDAGELRRHTMLGGAEVLDWIPINERKK